MSICTQPTFGPSLSSDQAAAQEDDDDKHTCAWVAVSRGASAEPWPCHVQQNTCRAAEASWIRICLVCLLK